MEVSMTRAAALLGLCSALACAPVTFSEPGAIDFDRYRRALIAGDGADSLAGELAATSGFAVITTDPRADVDVVIRVAVFREEHRTCECECDCGGGCSCESDYEATASFVAKTPAGALVDGGSENDTSATELEAIQDALDEVALHFIRPYRL
jgi:hypothetical protein